MISKQILLELFRSYFILFPNFLDSGGCEIVESEIRSRGGRANIATIAMVLLGQFYVL